MTSAIDKDLSIPFDATLDILKANEDEEGQWILEGFAATTGLDLQSEIVTQEAIDASANDLEGNSTVLLNHDPKIPIGRVLESEARDGGLFIKVLISKTVPEIWTKIKEGVLNKFSIRGKVIDAVREWSAKFGKFIKVIKKMLLVEASIVTIPANPDAKAMRWYIEKAFDLWESKGGELQTINSGGSDMAGQNRTEKDGLPDIVKDDIGTKTGDELIKAAGAHAALVKEKSDALAKIANEIASGATTMTPKDLQAKLNQLRDIGWQIDGDVIVVNAMGGEAAKSEGGETEKARGEGQGVGGEPQGDGGASVCVCPSCGETATHEKGLPCADVKCPKCGAAMEGKSIAKGFPTPEVLFSEWGECCKANDLAGELDDAKVFAKWVEFCKEKGYPEPYAYPYAEAEKAEDKEAKEVIALVDKLMEEADDAAKAILGQIKTLLSRMTGGASPYPTPSPVKAEGGEDTTKSDNKGNDDLAKAGAKMKSTRLSTLKTIIEKLKTLADDLTPELSKTLETMMKNLADETKAEESLESLQKTLADETQKTLSSLMSPIEKRLERIESIEGIQKSEQGQETTPDETGKKTGDGDDDEKGKPKSVWGGILGNSLANARAGFRKP